MEAAAAVIAYLQVYWDPLRTALEVHLTLSLLAVLTALALGVPLGILCARYRILAYLSIQVVSAIRVVPSLAVLVLALPYLGLGFRPALVALVILAVPPILINTCAAYQNVDRSVVEAAYGMGMSEWQVLGWVQTPLALPVLLAGLRTATVEVLASASLAAFIGGGGLGEFMINGLSLNDVRLLLLGAVPVALMALLAEGLFLVVERQVRERSHAA